MSSAPVFAAVAQEIPLDCLPLVGLHSWVPWSCNNWRDSSWQPTTPRALHREHTETQPQSFWERGLFVCPSTLTWSGFWSGLWRCSQGVEASGFSLWAYPLPRSSLLGPPRKELTHLSGALIFATASRGHLYITWLRWPMEKEFLSSLHPLGIYSKKQKTQELSLPVKEAY